VKVLNQGRPSWLRPTGVLVLMNLAVYVFTSVLGGDFLETDDAVLRLYGQANWRVLEGWYWQLFTAMFVHVNLIHIASNMLFLLIFGSRAEGLFGDATYLAVYLASGLVGNLLSLLPGPSLVSAGASGAIFGLFGASTVYLGEAFGQSIIIALVYSLYLLLLTAGAQVNTLAHFGGLVAGLLMGYSLGRRHRSNLRRRLEDT